jgi:hypothetical protein
MFEPLFQDKDIRFFHFIFSFKLLELTQQLPKVTMWIINHFRHLLIDHSKKLHFSSEGSFLLQKLLG